MLHALEVMATLPFFFAMPATASTHEPPIGINVLLDQPATPGILANLQMLGDVLDIIPEIRAVTLRAQGSELDAIRALPHVTAAEADSPLSVLGIDGLPFPDCSLGLGLWSLDAMNVTESGSDPARTVPFAGEGIYVAVLDTGLAFNWREYFPEQRIAMEHARAFGGGGGERGTVSEQPRLWEHDAVGHGTMVTGIVLGFGHSGVGSFNGVAPKATVIPVKVMKNSGGGWGSTLARGLIYVTNLKIDGMLGDAPLVVNLSIGTAPGTPFGALDHAATDYALAHGVVVVASAGNVGDAGMSFPAAYPPVISAGYVGWKDQFPADDPTTIDWILRDVPENDPSQYFVLDSSVELPGQDLDVSAPGWAVAAPLTMNGRVDYTFFVGSSASAPHVAGLAALMLQKNPGLPPAAIEAILESTALPLTADCRTIRLPSAGSGNPPTWSDHGNVSFLDETVCWPLEAVGRGLVRADAALDATPWP